MNDTQASGSGQARLPETASEFHVFMREQARRALMELIEQEIESLCGPRYHPSESAQAYRSGSTVSTVYVHGAREEVRRPRVRRSRPVGSEEVALKSWQLARDPEEWEQAMMRAILCGVSTRNIAALRESEVRGESKSSLSRLWQAKAAELVEQVQNSDLSTFDPLVLMLDAVVLCKDLVATVALGIDTGGTKRILGFRIGSSENEEVCTDLLSALRRRGLQVPEHRNLLAVLDGSKVLKNALLRQYPAAIIQRCLVHKERNVRGYLPSKHWKVLAGLFDRLRKSQGADAAREAAEQIESFLRDKNAQALQSFEEAGEELLALFRLEVPNTLNKSLLSTNAIENAFKNLRRHIGRVCRWRNQTPQADLWVASGLILASKCFRSIRGYHHLEHLAKALTRSSREPNHPLPK